jgi:hypothetical protein
MRRQPCIWLGGLVMGVAMQSQAARAEPPAEILAVSPASVPVAPAVAVAAVTSVVTADRPPVYTLRLAERQVLARFIPEVRARRDLRERAVALWRAHFVAEANAIRARFLQEEDWRPAFADAAALIDDFLEASLLPRAGEFPAGEGRVWIESIDSSGQRVRARHRARPRAPILAPEVEKAHRDGVFKRRPASKAMPVRGRQPVRR